MDDMDSLLKELENSVQKEIQQEKNKDPVAKASTYKNSIEDDTEEKLSLKEVLEMENAKRKNVTEARKKSEEIENALSDNVEPALLSSPIVNIVEPAVTIVEPSPEAHGGLLNVNFFPRAGSTSSIREETESADPDVKYTTFAKIFNKEGRPLNPIVHTLKVEEGFRKVGSSGSILDDGEDDEDEMMKALELLDEKNEVCESGDKDNVYVTRDEPVIDKEDGSEKETVKNKFDISTDVKPKDDEAEHVVFSEPDDDDVDDSAAVDDVDGEKSVAECIVDVNLQCDEKAKSISSVEKTHYVISNCDIQHNLQVASVEAENGGIKDPDALVNVNSTRIENTGIREDKVESIKEPQIEETSDLAHEGSQECITIKIDENTSEDKPTHVNRVQSDSTKLNSKELEAVGNIDLSIIAAAEDSILTPEMEAELAELEEELRGQGLLEDEIEDLKDFAKEELVVENEVQKEAEQVERDVQNKDSNMEDQADVVESDINGHDRNTDIVKDESDNLLEQVRQVVDDVAEQVVKNALDFVGIVDDKRQIDELDEKDETVRSEKSDGEDSNVTLRIDDVVAEEDNSEDADEAEANGNQEGSINEAVDSADAQNDHFEDQHDQRVESSENRDMIDQNDSQNDDNRHVQAVEDLDPDNQNLTMEVHGDLPTTDMHILPEQARTLSVIASTHTVGNVGTDLRLTESELQLGKVKPNWIKDDEYKKCMLCLAKFTLVNRRHHCRCCGRVLCSECCSIRRKLSYMEENEKAQRVCQPCNLTLDRIEVYEKMAENAQQTAQEAIEIDEPASSTASSESPLLARRKSVLKPTKSESEGQCPSENGGDFQRKRSVRFLDGIAPGADNTRQEGADGAQASTKPAKPKRVSSRKLKEYMAQDEGKLLLSDESLYTVADSFTGELCKITMEKVVERFTTGFVVTLVVKRNIYLVISYNNATNVVSVHTSGLSSLGVEEVLFAYETDDDIPQFPMNICNVLANFTSECLRPRTAHLDDINGIRFCGSRMANVVELNEGDGINGFKYIFWAPYMDQELNGITAPNVAFRVGILVKESEYPFIKALPMRVLTRLGMVNDVYPYPIVNNLKRGLLFPESEDGTQPSSPTILSMFHDFRACSYSMPYIATSCVIVDEGNTKVLLPVWAKEQMKCVLNSQMNLIAWACDISESCDSVLTCEYLGSSFQTRMFMKQTDRNCIGVSFVAFSTGYKGLDNEFTQTLVEDGVVIRFTGDTLEMVQKKLQNGDDFELESNGIKLKVEWVENALLNTMGPIRSPIDGLDLRGYIQYGLTMERALHSNNVFQNSRSYALRLGTVIRFVTKKLEPQLQSHFFDACEQLTMWLRSTLEDYVPLLIGMEMKMIAIRLYASQDNVGFELADWTGLEEAHSEYIGILSEKVLPILYQILASNTGDFNVELHLPIISVRPLPKEDELTE
ncbi:unnamed protein product [Bursaphelenchus okinawaensis]|uniref:FYVE-type domain-containing protein n=1 Tax=Bursaphelenchus okinawaensis TaxID=465554 RepID=A0A811K9E9_9BILA|nr:unnamed protein product [Bursaphelenchus okinawaensis]CAG9095756.1 unnamed protein product [Bursaphelenchus okinawaensis]